MSRSPSSRQVAVRMGRGSWRLRMIVIKMSVIQKERPSLVINDGDLGSQSPLSILMDSSDDFLTWIPQPHIHNVESSKVSPTFLDLETYRVFPRAIAMERRHSVSIVIREAKHDAAALRTGVLTHASKRAVDITSDK
jgi:stage III sporulation protein SpoIIIAA